MDTVSPPQTRSRSRSKTPFVPTERENANADQPHEKKRSPVRKEPTVQTIREEEEPAQTPAKRSKRELKSSNVSPVESTSGKKQQSNTSSSTVVKMTSTTKVLAQETTKSTTTTSSTQKTSQKTSSPKQDPVTQKEFNRGLEGSGIKISTPHNSKRAGPSGNVNGDLSDHVAYKEYKDAGEYWNKYPKTDYTYSKLSPHRREIIPGVIAMPNMSRKSLEKHAERVNQMALNNPSQESYIRARYESSRYAKSAGRALHYDSGDDEIDLAQFDNKKYVQVHHETIFKRLYTRIITTIFTTWHFVARPFKASETKGYYESTELTHEQKGFFQRFWATVSSGFLYFFQRIYLLVASVLLVDTWLLQSKTDGGRHKKKFLWFLIFLLPLLLFGALYLSEEDQKSKMLTFLPLSFGWTPSLFMSSITSWSWMDYLPRLHVFTFFPMSSQRKTEGEISNIHQHLTTEEYNRLLLHINQYIDTMMNKRDKEHVLSENLNILINKIVKENIVTYKYELTDADVDRIAGMVQMGLKTSQNAEPVITQELIDKITLSIRNGFHEESSENIEKIALKILQTNHLAQMIDKRIRDQPPLPDTSKYDDLIARLSVEISGIRDDLSTRNNRDDDINFTLEDLRTQQEMFNNQFNNFRMENELKFQNLLNELEGKINKLKDENFSEINKQIRRVLVQIFNIDQNESKLSESDLRSWITNIFVAKEYLEDRLNDIQGQFDDRMVNEIQRSAGILMRNITETLRMEVQSLIEMKTSSDNQFPGREIDVNEEHVRRIVLDILRVYDADKTGLVDYALESAGGQVLSTRCTESYHIKTAQISIFGVPLWYPSNTPRTAISPSVQPGNCWAFQGFPGFLVLKLNLPILVTGFTMEHIPKTLAPNGQIDSAPKVFSVWGLSDESDQEPMFFGKYVFEDNDRSLQYFTVENKAVTRLHQVIELRIESNHDNPTYTCLYRFRVHGAPEL